jgi:hypothetical protein
MRLFLYIVALAWMAPLGCGTLTRVTGVGAQAVTGAVFVVGLACFVVIDKRVPLSRRTIVATASGSALIAGSVFQERSSIPV